MSLARTERTPTWIRAIGQAVGFVVLLWALEAIDTALGHTLDSYGVRPRDDDGLVGILAAPLLHAGWDHLSANTGPVLILGFLVLVTGVGRGLAATAVIWIVGGVGVWLIAPSNTIHLGASVLIFGWLVYLIVRGAFTRKAGEIILGLTLLFAYGGLLVGVLPGQPGVSWQGHLFGAVGGVVAAAALGRGRAVPHRSALP